MSIGRREGGESHSFLDCLVKIRDRMEYLKKSDSQTDLPARKLEFRNALVRQRHSELRSKKILNRGKGQPVPMTKDVCTHAQSLLMPEIARIARAMSGTTELSFEEKIPSLKTYKPNIPAILMWSTFLIKGRFIVSFPRKPAKSSS